MGSTCFLYQKCRKWVIRGVCVENMARFVPFVERTVISQSKENVWKETELLGLTVRRVEFSHFQNLWFIMEIGWLLVITTKIISTKEQFDTCNRLSAIITKSFCYLLLYIYMRVAFNLSWNQYHSQKMGVNRCKHW